MRAFRRERRAGVRITSRRFKADPYPELARLRSAGPLARVRLSGRRSAVVLTRYEDCRAALLDERLVKDRANVPGPRGMVGPWVPRPFRPLTRNMLDLDGRDHLRLRALVQRAFTPRRVEELETEIGSLAHELLISVMSSARRGTPSMDLIADYAAPIPTTIIARLLGVPRADRARFRSWSNRIVSANGSPISMVSAMPSGLAFLRYLRRLVRNRRAEPRDDLVSALVQAESEGDRLDEDELVAMLFLLLVAGHETTVHLIGNGLIALLENPEQLELLRAEPTLMESGVEELLRYAGPLLFATERYAAEPVHISGASIDTGELVLVGLASANRDERQFEEPDRLILDRDPNRHIAFGHGAHYCLGAPLARLEARIAFTVLLRFAGRIELSAEPLALRWGRGLVLRGASRIPVRFVPDPET